MKDTCYIHLSGTPGAPKAWLKGDDLGVSSLALIAERCRDARVVVLVPGTDVLLASVSVPTRKRQHLIQALPYALEERLAGEVETLHFALGNLEPDGTAHAAVVARERMEVWLAELEQAGLTPHACYPETSVLPYSERNWSLLLTPERALLRTGPSAGAATDVELVAKLLELALANAPEAPERIQVFDCGEGETVLPARENVEWVRETVSSPLQVFARGVNDGQPVNLLQGDYSRQEASRKHWLIWRPAAVLAGILLLVQIGLSLQQALALSREDARLNEQIEQLYRQTFPEAKRVVAPQRQMEQQLEALRRDGEGAHFAELLTQVGPVLKTVPGLQLRALRYRDGQLEFELAVGNVQILDQLQQRFASGGLQAELTGASAHSGQVEGRLTVRRGGA